jgi:hypothetical protein
LQKGGLRYYEIYQTGDMRFYLLTLPFILAVLIGLPKWLVPLGIDAAFTPGTDWKVLAIMTSLAFISLLLPLCLVYYVLFPSGMDGKRESEMLDSELDFKTEFAIGNGVIELKNTPDAHSLEISKITHITIRNPDITEHYQIPGKRSLRGPARHHKSIHRFNLDSSRGVDFFIDFFMPPTFSVDVETADFVMTITRSLQRGRAIKLAKSIAQDMGLRIEQKQRDFAAYEASFTVK